MSLAYGQPPFDAPQVVGQLTLAHNPLSTFPYGKNLSLDVGVYNTTGLALGNDSTDCLFMLHESTGNELLNTIPEFNVSMQEWRTKVDSTYLSNNQDYQYSVYCNTTGLGGEIREAFQVTTGGREPGNPGATEAFIVLLPLLFCALLIYATLKMNDKQHGTLKYFMYFLIPPSFWASMHIATEVIIEFFPTWESFIETLAFYTQISGWIAGILFAYFFIWLFMTIIKYVAEKKKKKQEGLEYGEQ